MAIKVRYQNGSIKVLGENGSFRALHENNGGGGNSGNAEIYYDPGNSSSYNGGVNLTNIGSLGNVSGTYGTLSGVEYDSGVAGGVFNFGGSDQISFQQFDFGNEITVSAWVYPRNRYSINTVMSNAYAGLSSNGFKLEWNSWNTTDLKMLIEAGNGSSGNVISSSSAVIVENQWQYLTWVINFSSPTAYLYRNASLLSTSGGIVSNIGRNNPNWYIGTMAGSYWMNANLGEFKVWLSSKSSSDILSEFNATKSRYGI